MLERNFDISASSFVATEASLFTSLHDEMNKEARTAVTYKNPQPQIRIFEWFWLTYFHRPTISYRYPYFFSRHLSIYACPER